MFINDVNKKEEIKAIALRHLRKYGIKHRIKSTRPIQAVKSKKFFNVSLQNLENETVTLQNGQQLVIPKRLYEMCSFILLHVETEGLFRKEGSKSRQNVIKLSLDRGCMLGNDHHVIDVAVVLKSFLRQLPEPLIPYAFHELFLRCSLIEKKEEAILLACLLLPSEHLNVLCYLFQFLYDIAAFAKMNKMNSYNIAVVVGPNIFPVNEKVAPKSKLMIKKVCDIIKVLIEHSRNVGLIPEYIIEQIASPKTANIQTVSKTNRRRRSGSLTGIINGLKKMVGNKVDKDYNSAHIVTPDLLLTPSITSTDRKDSQNSLKMKQKKPQKKTILERRWSAITSATSLRRKKRESLIYQPNESLDSPKVDFVRVSKSEYEEIKNRVSAIEKRLSLELDNIQTTVLHNEVNIINNIQSVYEQTLEQAEPMSPGTDQLARRLSRELRIRNSNDKMIRSPSARKIGNIRRRSRESERPSKISKINSMQNISSDSRQKNSYFSSPGKSKAKEKHLNFRSETVISLNTPGNSFDIHTNKRCNLDTFDFKLNKFSERISPKMTSDQRGIKRSSSTTTYSCSPLKDRSNNRRSLELVSLNNSNKENDLISKELFYTPKMPQIKRAIPVSRTPKRLCTTPCSSRLNTPLKVIRNNFKTPKS